MNSKSKEDDQESNSLWKTSSRTLSTNVKNQKTVMLYKTGLKLKDANDYRVMMCMKEDEQYFITVNNGNKR